MRYDFLLPDTARWLHGQWHPDDQAAREHCDRNGYLAVAYNTAVGPDGRLIQGYVFHINRSHT